MYLTDRASLFRALFRLMDADATDGGVTEFDAADVPQEGLLLALQQGAEDAQTFLLGQKSSWWLKTSDALGFTQQSDGRYYTDLPDDFRRLFGDPGESALHYGAGERWGIEIHAREQWNAPSNSYFLQGAQLWLTRRSAPPADLRMDYTHRLAEIVDGKEVDFPQEDRGLIVAYTAVHAREESWYTGGPLGDQRIERNLNTRKRLAARRARRTSTPLKVGTPRVSDRWALVGG